MLIGVTLTVLIGSARPNLSNATQKRNAQMAAAIERSNAKRVHTLLLRGVNPNGSARSLSYLQLAVMRASIDVVRQLLKAGAEPNKPDHFGDTALHAAADRGSRSIVNLLISKGANVNAHNDLGATPLFLASSVYVARVLVAHGADPNATVKDGQSVLDAYVEARRGDLVMYLVHAGAKVSAQDSKGNTPLMYSVSGAVAAEAKRSHRGRAVSLRIAKFLMTRGADPNVQNVTGESPITLARRARDCSLLRVLLNPGGRRSPGLTK